MARGRPRKALLSREMIVETALRQIDAGEDLNMSKVARELGVHVSSLYNHVEDREGLLEQIRLYLAHEYPVPPLEGMSWQETVRAVATTIHAAYVAHPRLVPYLAPKPASAPEIIAVYSHLTQVMLDAGHKPKSTAIAIRMIDTLALGTAMVNASERTDWEGSLEGWRSLIDVSTYWSDERAMIGATFEWGLHNLVTGLEAELAAVAG